jgi:predicted RNase H-like nuclease
MTGGGSLFADDFVAGVDGCRSGWICFALAGRTREARVLLSNDFVSLLEELGQPQIVAMDIPIGLVEKGSRQCDLAARKILGKKRGSSVFPAPIRSALSAHSYSEACNLSRRISGKAVSKQSYAILPKIREIDSWVTIERQEWLHEVHPEVCFWALNGCEPMKYKKSSAEGMRDRLMQLSPIYPDLKSRLALLNRKAAAPDDLLDAAVACWTAERILSGTAGSVCGLEVDTHGLRMGITY